jgi:hypothetical protein
MEQVAGAASPVGRAMNRQFIVSRYNQHYAVMDVTGSISIFAGFDGFTPAFAFRLRQAIQSKIFPLVYV